MKKPASTLGRAVPGCAYGEESREGWRNRKTGRENLPDPRWFRRADHGRHSPSSPGIQTGEGARCDEDEEGGFDIGAVQAPGIHPKRLRPKACHRYGPVAPRYEDAGARPGHRSSASPPPDQARFVAL